MTARAGARVRIGVSIVLAVGAAGHPARVERQDPSPHVVGIWMTTPDRSRLLAPQAPVSFAPDAGTVPVTVDVDASITYQEMYGFGASFTDSSAWLVANRLSSVGRRQLMMQLFDPASGIGLSYLRQPMGASDFALGHYSYDDMPAGQADPGLTHFSIDHDRAYILPLLREALAINPALRILATPWSAPGWMKSTGSMIEGTLNASAEADYANYFVRFIRAYQAEGVPIHRVTPQNEPHYTPPDYPGMWMGPAQQARFVGNHLGPALAAAGLQTGIDVWDHNWDDTTYAPSIFSDPAASRHVAGTAWHCYAGEPGAMSAVHDRFPEKEVVFTECSGFTGWTFGAGFRNDMEQLIIAAPRNWASTIVKWNVALDTNNGPHTGGCWGCTGLVTIDQATGRVAFNFDYYALGHLSKFVVPGARRIASNTFGPSSIQDVAFINPDGSRALLVFNAGTASAAFKVREGSQAFAYTLPSGAAATFTWGGPAFGSEPTDLALNRPVVASSSEGTAYPATNAVDGDPGSRWSSAFSDPQWLQVDLGSRYAVSKVVLNWELAFAAAYELHISDDAQAWRTVYSTASGPGGLETVNLPWDATGRYLRVFCTSRTYVYGRQWGYSLWDLQVFGAPTTATPAVTDLALNRPAWSSSDEAASYAAAHAVDGDPRTRWSSAFSDPQWLQVDLGSRYALSSVVLSWELAFAAAYELQVSDDALTWRTLYSTATGQGGLETIDLPAGAAGRYLRVFCTSRTYVYGRQWGYSLWDLQAFGLRQ